MSGKMKEGSRKIFKRASFAMWQSLSDKLLVENGEDKKACYWCNEEVVGDRKYLESMRYFEKELIWNA